MARGNADHFRKHFKEAEAAGGKTRRIRRGSQLPAPPSVLVVNNNFSQRTIGWDREKDEPIFQEPPDVS